MPIIDTLYTYKFIKLLSTDWMDMPAYDLGIIDDEGNPIKKSWELETSEEKKSYSSFHRLVFKLKRMLEKVPGGRSATVRYSAALALIREEVEENNMSIPFNQLEEALEKYFKEEVTNATGGVDKPEKPMGGVHKRKHTDKVGVAVEGDDGDGVNVEKRKSDKSPSDKTPDRKKANEELEDEYEDDDYEDEYEWEDVDDWDDNDPDLEYDPEFDGEEDEWEEMTDDEFEEYLSKTEDVSYQVVGGVLIRSIDEARKLTVRIKAGKRIKRIETKRKGFTRTGKRKLRGAKLSRKRRSLKKAIRKSHRSGALRKRKRSLVKRKRFVH